MDTCKRAEKLEQLLITLDPAQQQKTPYRALYTSASKFCSAVKAAAPALQQMPHLPPPCQLVAAAWGVTPACPTSETAKGPPSRTPLQRPRKPLPGFHSEALGAQVLHEVGHLDGGQRALVPLVARLAARAVQRLRQVRSTLHPNCGFTRMWVLTLKFSGFDSQF